MAIKKLKLDLHIHCQEAVWFSEPTIEVVARIIAAVKSKGLDGIAITDHAKHHFAYKVKDIVETHFANEIVIIPGQELDYGSMDIIELYLPGNRIFRFIAHPGYPGPFSINGREIHGIELENSGHYWHMDKDRIIQFALEHNLLMLKNSDAHYLEDIGKCCNEISWQAFMSIS